MYLNTENLRNMYTCLYSLYPALSFDMRAFHNNSTGRRDVIGHVSHILDPVSPFLDPEVVGGNPKYVGWSINYLGIDEEVNRIDSVEHPYLMGVWDFLFSPRWVDVNNSVDHALKRMKFIIELYDEKPLEFYNFVEDIYNLRFEDLQGRNYFKVINSKYLCK